eukprot:scaffold46079_cov75-Phaeocystis_antarctica.AAC.4
MFLIGQAEELRCEGHLERGVCEGARHGVHRGIRVVTRRQGEVRVVLAPRRVAGEERCHPRRGRLAELVAARGPRPAGGATRIQGEPANLSACYDRLLSGVPRRTEALRHLASEFSSSDANATKPAPKLSHDTRAWCKRVRACAGALRNVYFCGSLYSHRR